MDSCPDLFKEFYSCVCVFGCVYMYLVCASTHRGVRVPATGFAVICNPPDVVLCTELGFSSALNCWAVYPAPVLT